MTLVHSSHAEGVVMTDEGAGSRYIASCVKITIILLGFLTQDFQFTVNIVINFVLY